MNTLNYVPFPWHKEVPLQFDKEPVRSRLAFTNIKERKENHIMTKEEYVIHIIQHTDDFPETGEIDLASAQSMLNNACPSKSIPEITPEEFVHIWNTIVHNPQIMLLN